MYWLGFRFDWVFDLDLYDSDIEVTLILVVILDCKKGKQKKNEKHIFKNTVQIDTKRYKQTLRLTVKLVHFLANE